MIKLYGIDSQEFPQCTAEEIRECFKDREGIQVDAETYGFDPHLVEMMCFQMGDYNNQFIIAPDRIREFKALLEEKTLIGHNIKFDLKFLYHKDIWPTKVYDTFLAEDVINCGLKLIKRGLAPVAKRRLNVDLDKSVRDNIWKEGLTKRVLEYSADDVKYLELIREKQFLDLSKYNLHGALRIENQFVLCLAYIEYCGFRLDVDKWKEKMAKDEKAMNEAKEKLNNWILDNNIKRFISAQMDMFNPLPTITISWSSPKQVIELFNILKIPTKIVENGEEKESVEAKHINKHKKKFPIVGLYLDFKEKEKVVTTYGQSWIDQINPVTGRLHTTFRQVLDTSRLSSGGKNKNTKEEYKNFQNIPNDKETRACFVASPGNTLVGCDYSGQEQIVLANFSMDRNLLKFYDEGLGDMHCFVASKMYPELENDFNSLTVDEFKEKYKDQRQESKIAGFAINYGGVGKTIADQLDKDEETGNRIYDAYFKAFPDLKGYFENKKKQGLRDGFILFNDISHRKSFIGNHEEYKRLRQIVGKNGYWDIWASAKRSHQEDRGSEKYFQMKEEIKKFFQIKGEIERKSLNFPIQGTSAEITKLSGVYFFEWLRENHLLKRVLFVNTVHDENIVECPIEIKDKVAEALKECMIRSGQIYCKRVPLKVEPTISEFWKK